jgi:hypothetical protein
MNQLVLVSNWQDAENYQSEIIPKSAGERESLKIEGLEHHTTYYFIIRCADERPNWSPISNIANGTTLDMPKLKICPSS